MAAPVAQSGTKVVRYDGYTFSVPAAWPVYRLGPGSTRCVRYDTSAVYLGTPGRNQECPAQLVGQADTVSVAASKAPGRRGRPVIELQSAEVGAQVTTAQPDARPGLAVTATYGADPGTVRQILNSVKTRADAPVVIHQSAVAAPPAAPASPPAAPPARAPGPAAQAVPAAGASQVLTPAQRAWAQAAQRWYAQAWAYYQSHRGSVPKPPAPPAATPAPPATGKAPPATGKAPPAPPKPRSKPGHGTVPAKHLPTTHLKAPGAGPLPGFDTCTAPSLQAMRAWRHSYSVAAIYIGGAEMACDYGNLSASWVKAVTAMGWSLIPLYVGLQAPCNGFSQEIQSSAAAPEGAAAARSAILDARSFGLGRGTPIYFDMEAYNSGSRGCRNSVLSFLSQWTRQLHGRGYVSGVYSSAASGAEDLGNATSVYGHRLDKPDSMWFALWDNRANLAGTPYLLNSWWNPDRRIKQYKGSHWEKVGGVKLNIDSDWVQGPVY